jgi:hypothetical protein
MSNQLAGMGSPCGYRKRHASPPAPAWIGLTGDFPALMRHCGTLTRDFAALTWHFPALTRHCGALTRDFRALTRHFRALTRDFQQVNGV